MKKKTSKKKKKADNSDSVAPFDESPDITEKQPEPNSNRFLDESPIKKKKKSSDIQKKTLTKVKRRKNKKEKGAFAQKAIKSEPVSATLFEEKQNERAEKNIKKEVQKTTPLGDKSTDAVDLNPFTTWLMSLKPTETEPSKDIDMSKEKKKKNNKKKTEKSDKKKQKKQEQIAKKKDLKKDKKLRKKEKSERKKQKKKDKLQRKIDASLERKTEIVSPTLAAFMVKQGHFKEAIKIYKQLKLKYPEKKSYFASEIKKLKKLC